nr:uncharacterized protein LOC129382125 [Dermacentor andersoni]
MVQRQVTAGPIHHEFTPQVATFKADAELSHRKATNELTNLAESTGLVISQSADGECFPIDGYNPQLDIDMAFADPFSLDNKYYLKPMPIMYKTKGFTGTVHETFILDEGLGNNTIVSIISESAGNYSLMAWLVDPMGKRCPNCEEVESGREKSLTIPSPAMGPCILSGADDTEVDNWLTTYERLRANIKCDEPAKLRYVPFSLAGVSGNNHEADLAMCTYSRPL